jgi:Ca2+-transporting ATPase
MHLVSDARSEAARADQISATGLPSAHAQPAHAVLKALQSSPHGLTRAEAAARLQRFGPNTLPRPQPPGIVRLFVRQFLSPLIYILVVAAAVSVVLREWSDALFIAAVLLINAVIGTAQEYAAERSAAALQQLVALRARVLRQGEAFEVDAEQLVPGDVVLLESGSQVPADLRLLVAQGLEIDESLLTGESLPVRKEANAQVSAEAALGDRLAMAFAGTLVTRGRGRGVVVATGLATELGRLAAALLEKEEAKPPLLQRMERFTSGIAMVVSGAALAIFAVEVSRGAALFDIFFLAVALAVSAIPEGLPVALTVALSIAMRRMARRHVIIRRMVAAEALGSCTCIASDKTGTLTLNRLTARRLVFPGQEPWEVGGEGLVPEGQLLPPRGLASPEAWALLHRLAEAVVLCNEAWLGQRDSTWVAEGDAVDVALLVLARKAGVTQAEALGALPLLAQIPFESARQFAATLHLVDGQPHAFVKGALERVLPMCAHMAVPAGDARLDPALIEGQATTLAHAGYRVLAVAAGPLNLRQRETFAEEHLAGLTLLGLVGMIDPLRPEAKAAVMACRQAGIAVAMVTGDHPVTALAIARELGLASGMDEVVTGPELKQAEGAGAEAIDALTARARVFARVEPQQKLRLVQSLMRQGHFVAVTGAGANDAPALRAAHVGVAMGQTGTDVARESADLIIADDTFASIVAGVEEGRGAYNNVRKVIFLLVSTGAAEIVLFFIALFTRLPLPLLAVQLLWLNLVTNGIQHVALAFEPLEGDEMQHPPRPPQEPIFNRVMVERVLVSAVVIGGLAFAWYAHLLATGMDLVEARNSAMLLMVLFENVHVFNSRSERRSVLQHNPLRNPFLLVGTLAAQLVHIGAMYTPMLRDMLHIQPVSFEHWLTLLGLALVVLAVMEIHKALRQRWP